MRLESRHWVFLGLFLVILLSMLLQIDLGVKVSQDTQRMHDYIENLPPGSVLMLSFDHEASSLPEIRPLALAVLRHAFANGHKLIGVALLAEGTGIGYRLMEQVGKEYGKVYGEDYAFLGFKPQYIAAMLSMGESIRQTFPEDYLGRPYDDLPMLAGITNYEQVDGVISIADGSLTTHWVEYAGNQYGVRVSAAVAAAMVTTYDPYLASGQMHAMIGGLRGAAEYEQLIHRGGSGLRGMLAQTAAHVYVILMIIAGNVVYFLNRKKGRKR
ncbi:hypothetical protein GF420_01825 [candidate division GN15 bacterium]|nr:hypothetical protein [candidate division GN15 bacterium]